MLCAGYDDKILKLLNWKKSFLKHFCKSKKLKWKPSIIWNFKETIENQKTEKQHNLRHLFCILLKNLKIIKIILRKTELFSNEIKVLYTLNLFSCSNNLMLSPVTLQLQYKNFLSLFNEPVMYRLSKILVILFIKNISLKTLYIKIKKEYLQK